MNTCNIVLDTFVFILVLHCVPSLAYRTYYVEDECTSHEKMQKVVYNVPASGPNSVGEMRTNRFGTYSRVGRNCMIKLVPPRGYGLVVTVTKVDFRNHEPCDDYIKIYTDEDNHGEKLCGYRDYGTQGKPFFSDSKVQIVYHTEDGGFGFNDGFRLIFTVSEKVKRDEECSYENQFKCANLRCIWIGATCDGQDNCGDSSDESITGSSQCPSLTPLTITVIALAITMCFAILIAVCLCCCRVHREPLKTRIETDFPSRPNDGYIPLPGYIYGTDDRTQTMFSPYHTVYPTAPIDKRTTDNENLHYPQMSALELPPPYRP